MCLNRWFFQTWSQTTSNCFALQILCLTDSTKASLVAGISLEYIHKVGKFFVCLEAISMHIMYLAMLSRMFTEKYQFAKSIIM